MPPVRISFCITLQNFCRSGSLATPRSLSFCRSAVRSLSSSRESSARSSPPTEPAWCSRPACFTNSVAVSLSMFVLRRKSLRT
eukprot:4045663-Prymnesium_polylepis.1